MTDERTAMRPFGQVIELILALGLSDLDRLPAPWVHDIDGEWRVLVNVHEDAVASQDNKVVPGKAMYFEFRGRAAAMVTVDSWVHDQTVPDGGRRALINALDRAIHKRLGHA